MAPTPVRELAHELGVDSGLVLAWLRDLGVTLVSASADVPPDAELRLRAAHAAGVLHPHGDSSESSGPPAGDTSIHPRSSRGWSRVLAESRRRSTAWEDYWIGDQERRQWISAGLGPDDGRIAGRLRDRGFAPGDLMLRVDGVRASERLRGGEPVSLVIARLRELKRSGNADAG